MACDLCGSLVTKQEVTCHLELPERWILVEKVPARVCGQCGEKLFDTETVEKLQTIAWGQQKPERVQETAVFDFTKVSLQQTARDYSAPCRGLLASLMV